MINKVQEVRQGQLSSQKDGKLTEMHFEIIFIVSTIKIPKQTCLMITRKSASLAHESFRKKQQQQQLTQRSKEYREKQRARRAALRAFVSTFQHHAHPLQNFQS